MASAESYGWSWYVNDQQNIIVEHNSGMFIGEGIKKNIWKGSFSPGMHCCTHTYIYIHMIVYIKIQCYTHDPCFG